MSRQSSPSFASTPPPCSRRKPLKRSSSSWSAPVFSSRPDAVTTLDRARLLDEVVVLVRADHAEIMRVYEQPIQARLKDDCSPLTEADLASHRVLTEGLARLMPSFPIVSEEGELPSADVRASWPAYWLVDPLD